MCGICGIYNFRLDKPVDSTTIDRMCQCMIHRGPDDQGL